MLMVLLLSATMLQAQSVQHKVNWRDARITRVGAYMVDVDVQVKQNPETQMIDTVFADKSRMVWADEGVDMVNIENNDFYRETEPADIPEVTTGDAEADSLLAYIKPGLRVRKSSRAPIEQSGVIQETAFAKFYYYVFRFEYPSIDAAGKPITLSAMCACPPRNGPTNVNNIVLGTHITITADKEAPSYQTNNWEKTDWGMYFSLAAGCKLNYKSWVALIRYLISFGFKPTDQFNSYLNDLANVSPSAPYNYDLVIMPDYEGYGTTNNRAHPYLYQELTARQSVDALLYGKALYESSPELFGFRHNIRSNFRTIVSGYSQGGSVAMACHRFIEQNDLAKDLHFTGSFCGDGPYDPLATLMYYVKQSEEDKYMSMAVVLPLIMKGMLDTNPYMLNHKASDYFVQKFLDTGIMDWLGSKQYNTDEIGEKFGKCYDEGLNGDVTYFRDIIQKQGSIGRVKMKNVMTPACYSYFLNLYNTYKDTYTSAEGIPLPAHRGVIEDLHFALASNNMTAGWNPEHKMILFHSTDDTVVPYNNYTSAANRLNGNNMIEHWKSSGQDHVDSGTTFFSKKEMVAVALHDGLNLTDAVRTLCNLDY